MTDMPEASTRHSYQELTAKCRAEHSAKLAALVILAKDERALQR